MVVDGMEDGVPEWVSGLPLVRWRWAPRPHRPTTSDRAIMDRRITGHPRTPITPVHRIMARVTIVGDPIPIGDEK